MTSVEIDTGFRRPLLDFSGVGSSRRYVVETVLLWAASKVLAYGLAVVARAFLEDLRRTDRWGYAPWNVFFSWDSEWFLSIAKNGYFGVDSAPNAAAFFPGYPLLSGALGEVLGGTETAHVVALALVSNLASLAAVLVLRQLLSDHFDPAAARVGVLLFLFGPYSIYLTAPYSEPLFLAFAMGAWLAASRDRWWTAAALCATASMIRPNGAFLVGGLFVLALVSSRGLPRVVLVKRVVASACGVTGFAAYLLYLVVSTGRLNAWGEAQEAGWERRTSWPWDAAAETVRGMLGRQLRDERIQFGLDLVFAVAAVAVLMILLALREWPMATYVALTIGSLMTSLTYLSLARNTLLLFPIYLLAARFWRDGTTNTRIGIGVFGALGLILFALNTVSRALGWWTD